MSPSPPPHGLTDLDYEAIEAAVTETVRGRWFLSEFARRNRLAETHQLLDAMARLEAAVASTQAALPSADPSIRLMIQRIKEVAAELDAISSRMSEAGVDRQFVDEVALQGRAVAGMMRGGPSARDPLPPPSAAPKRLDQPTAKAPVSRPPAMPAPVPKPPEIAADDPRLPALSGLDGLPLAEKLALFT